MITKLTIFLLAVFILFLSPGAVLAQRMMDYQSSPSSSISSSDIQAQQQEETEGKDFLDKLSSKQITCQNLTDNDFEKIGEYYMGRALGDTSRHIAMNNMMKSMMGDSGEEQMHIAWGKRGSGCDANATYPVGMMGVTAPIAGMMRMMGGFDSGVWGTGNYGMMGWNGANNWYGIFGIVTSLLVVMALVLANIWLWKQIRKK